MVINVMPGLVGAVNIDADVTRHRPGKSQYSSAYGLGPNLSLNVRQ